MNNETLREIFAAEAEQYGVEVMRAEFESFRDLKVRWMRCAHQIEFTVTDYLSQAPEEIVEELAKTLLTRIYIGSDETYSDAFADWVTSEEFVRLNRDTYLERCKVLSSDFESKHHDLQETYENLVSKGLIEEIPGLSLKWTDNRSIEPLGVSSVLMRSIVVPTYMDNENIPDDLFEFNLFRLLTNIEMDFKIDPMERKMLTEEKIASYPDSRRLMDSIEDHRNLAECGVI